MNLQKQTLLILAGPPLHGKTSLGNKLAEQIRLAPIDVDEIRLKHFPATVAQGGARGKDGSFNLDADVEITTVCYRLAIDEIDRLMAMSIGVIFTGALSKDVMKEPLLNWIRIHPEINTIVIKLAGELSIEEAQERIGRRLSEGSNSPIVEYETYLKTVELQTPWPTNAGFACHEVAVGPPIEEMVTKVLDIIGHH